MAARVGKFGSYISIHAPREGGDHKCRYKIVVKHRFQSTPPARGATPSGSVTVYL